MKKFSYFLTIAVAVFLLAGCFGGGSPVPADTYYRLPSREPSSLKLSKTSFNVVAVSSLKSDDLHRERAILYSARSAPLTLKRYHYHHWTNIPNNLIQENLIDYLRKTKLAKQVVRYGQQSQVDAHLSGHIKRFERVTGGGSDSVVVEIEFQIEVLNSAKRKIYYKNYAATNKSTDSSMQAAVESFGTALHEIYQRFLQDLVQEKLILS